MNQERFYKMYPMGSHLCRTPMPAMSEMKRDMALLKKKNFNMIKIQEQWAVDEPREGECDFSALVELIAFAGELDMGVYLGLSCEQAPPWIWEKYPDAAMEGRGGGRLSYIAQTSVPGDGKPGPCPDHPGVAAEQGRFIGQLVRELGTFENIVVWNTWQEIGYWAERLAGDDVCYCPHTLTHFREWLQEKYGSLDELNRAYRTRYGAWRYVMPNRGKGRFTNPVDIDWKLFQNGAFITRTLAARAEAIRANDPLGRPVFAHIDIPLNGSGTPWLYGKTQDFLGSSCYPAWFSLHDWDDARNRPGGAERQECLLTELWDAIVMRFDYLRSAQAPEAPLWAAELQGGPVSTGLHWGRTPSEADIRRWVGSLLFAGATGISYWVTRAEIMAHELNGYSLLDSAGDSTERFEEAGRLAGLIGGEAELFNSRNLEPADVGILVNEENYALLSTLDNQGEEHLGFALRGWHRLLWESGAAVDFVSLDHCDRESLAGYKLLILPFPLSLSREKGALLTEYIRGGGFLCADACPGRIDPLGFANRGEMLPLFRELLGISSSRLSMVREPGGEERYTPSERGWGELIPGETLEGRGPFEGIALESSLYLETYCSDRAETVFESSRGSAGLLVREGAGRFLLVGTFPSYRATAFRREGHFAFARRLLAEAGAAVQKSGPVVYRVRKSPGRSAWILINTSEERARAVLPREDGVVCRALFGGRAEPADGSCRVTLEGLDTEVIVMERKDEK